MGSTSEVAEAHRAKGNEFYKQGKYDEAIKHYSESLAIEYTSNALNNRIMAYMKNEQYIMAIADANTELAINSTNLKAMQRKGMALQRLERYKEAAEVYEAYLELNTEAMQDDNQSCGEVQKLLEECLQKGGYGKQVREECIKNSMNADNGNKVSNAFEQEEDDGEEGDNNAAQFDESFGSTAPEQNSEKSVEENLPTVIPNTPEENFAKNKKAPTETLSFATEDNSVVNETMESGEDESEEYELTIENINESATITVEQVVTSVQLEKDDDDDDWPEEEDLKKVEENEQSVTVGEGEKGVEDEKEPIVANKEEEEEEPAVEGEGEKSVVAHAPPQVPIYASANKNKKSVGKADNKNEQAAGNEADVFEFRPDSVEPPKENNVPKKTPKKKNSTGRKRKVSTPATETTTDEQPHKEEENGFSTPSLASSNSTSSSAVKRGRISETYSFHMPSAAYHIDMNKYQGKELSPEDQLSVDFERDEANDRLKLGTRVFALWKFSRSYYPAKICGYVYNERYCLEFFDGAKGTAPDHDVIPMAKITPGQLLFMVENEEAKMVEIVAQPNSDDPKEWLEAQFEVSVNDGEPNEKVSWEKLYLSREQFQLLKGKEPGKETAPSLRTSSSRASSRTPSRTPSRQATPAREKKSATGGGKKRGTAKKVGSGKGVVEDDEKTNGNDASKDTGKNGVEPTDKEEDQHPSPHARLTRSQSAYTPKVGRNNK